MFEPAGGCFETDPFYGTEYTPPTGGGAGWMHARARALPNSYRTVPNYVLTNGFAEAATGVKNELS